MSTVRSVSGFAVDVLKLGPLYTMNHCPFLIHSSELNSWKMGMGAYFCAMSFRFRRSASAFSPAFNVPVESTSRISFCVVSSIEAAYHL